MLNNQWLQTFITLVEVGHFTQTAEKLFMTQPGVSQHIKKLEAQTGVPLLHRFAKRFELTHAGEALYQFACKRKLDEEVLFKSLQRDDPYVGECRIACSGSMAMLLYAPLLARQKAYPELVISVEAAPNQRIISDVVGNQADIGIVTQRSGSPELEQSLLGVEPLCLVLPSAYHNKPVNFSCLDTLGFIDHPDGAHYAQQLLSANFADEYQSVERLNKSGYINQLSQILLPVAAGLGYTILPTSAVHSFAQQALIYVMPTEQLVCEELFLVTKKSRPLATRYDWFLAQIRQLVSKQGI